MDYIITKMQSQISKSVVKIVLIYFEKYIILV